MAAPRIAVAQPGSVASDADRATLLKHIVAKDIQAFSLLTPPLLLAHAAYRKSFSVRTFLRNQALATFVVGGAVGTGLGLSMMRGMDAGGIADRAYRLKMNAGQVRVDDWSVIGGVLGAIITPTFLLKRAPTPYLVTGGAALGIAGGIIAHIAKNQKDGTAAGVGMMVDEAKSLTTGK